MNGNDDKLCDELGLDPEEVGNIADRYDSGDFSDMEFGTPRRGKPRLCDEELVTVTVKIPQSRIAAMERVQREQGITRSEFVRRAIDHELVEFSS